MSEKNKNIIDAFLDYIIDNKLTYMKIGNTEIMYKGTPMKGSAGNTSGALKYQLFEIRRDVLDE